MFKNIKSLENGYYLVVRDAGNKKSIEYWDLVYPESHEIKYNPDEEFYAQRLFELIKQSVKLRLRADVPVGLYISGGLDSSFISIIARELTPNERRFSFSIDFEEKDKSESMYQRVLADYIQSFHFEKMFFYPDISERLTKAVYHSEYPLKETYNTASLALSEAARQENIKVVLSGEGADEWFAGYPGYKFDKFASLRNKNPRGEQTPAHQLNKQTWGYENFNFDMDQYAFRKVKRELYSGDMNQIFTEIDSLQHPIIDKQKVRNRHMIHVRSYLDYKLRLVGHLIADHGTA
jgi:asparagine synthase (glutamine-hydrolysing)